MQPTSGNKPRITIIGLGWLGQALAMRWQQHGGQVFGSCRTAEKRTQLQQQGVSAFTWQSGEPVELPSADCLDSRSRRDPLTQFYFPRRSFALS